MADKQRALDVIHRRGSGGGAFWSGHLSQGFAELAAREWGAAANRLGEYLQNDCAAVSAGGYKHPGGLPEWDFGWGMEQARARGHFPPGCFAQAESIADVAGFPWPNPAYYDFSETYAAIDKHADKVVFTGLWSSLFSTLNGLFGMENCMIQMCENPGLIEYVMGRIVDYYVAANEKFFAGAGGRGEVLFIGIDMGTQRDLMLSPAFTRWLLLPGIQRLAEVGHKHGRKVMLHSCGSIWRVIPDIIDAGVDILHPLQAQAAGMGAAELAQYKNDLAFCGGIDAQSFIVGATPQQVADEVERVYGLLGPNIILSPSHEEVLPNVPPANLLAMARAAKRCA